MNTVIVDSYINSLVDFQLPRDVTGAGFGFNSDPGNYRSESQFEFITRFQSGFISGFIANMQAFNIKSNQTSKNRGNSTTTKENQFDIVVRDFISKYGHNRFIQFLCILIFIAFITSIIVAIVGFIEICFVAYDLIKACIYWFYNDFIYGLELKYLPNKKHNLRKTSG